MIKPCPFCGGMPRFNRYLHHHGLSYYWVVSCECGIEHTTRFSTRKKAVEAWNTRKEQL